MIKYFTLLIALAMPALGFAQTKASMYVEPEFSMHKVHTPGMGSFSLNGVGVALGKVVLPNLALEALVGKGTSEDTQSLAGFPVTLKGGTSYGVYARPFIAVNDKLELFARLGYVSGEGTATVFGVSTTDTTEDFSYGVGVAFKVKENIAIVGNYTLYSDKGGTKADGFGVGVRFGF